MKLSELSEMAFRVGEWKFPVNDATIKQIFPIETEITKLEDGRFSLRQNDDKFGLFDGDTLVAFAHTKIRTIHEKTYREIVAIYVPQEMRSMGFSTILLFALKEIEGAPLLFDDALFDDGWKLLNNIAKSHSGKFQSVRKLDKVTGEITSFTGDEPQKNDAYIVENDGMGFYRDYDVLGRVYFNMFADIL